MSKEMEKLEHMLCDELDKIAQQGELTSATLDTVQKLSHSLKSLKTVHAMDESQYSGEMMPHVYGNAYADRRYGRDDYIRNDYSRGDESYYGRGSYDGDSYARDRYYGRR